MAAIAFGTIALILASGFIEWLFYALRESTIRAQLGHVQIVRPGYHQAGRADPFAYLLPSGGPALDIVAKEAGVTAIAPRLFFSGLVSHGDETLSFVGEGVSPREEGELSRAMTITDGVALSDGDTDGAMFGAGLARNLGVAVGDRVVLVVNKRSGGINAIELATRGIFMTASKAYDDSALRVSIGTAQKLLRVAGAHVWLVLLDDTDLTTAATASLRSKLASREFDVVPWYDLADFYNKTVSLFSKQVNVLRLIIAAIIVLSITNTMMMSVMERTREIGTSMAVGVRRSRILALFIAEGTLLGVIGGLVGVAAGAALAVAISHVGIPMPPSPGMAHGYLAEIRLTTRMPIEAFGLSVVTALVASIYPAWRASRFRIVDALRHNR